MTDGHIALQQSIFILRHHLLSRLGIPPSCLAFARAAAIALALAALAPLLAGCNEPDAAVASVSQQAVEPDVSIVTVKPAPRAVVRELPGRIAPTRISEVRPRVSGIIVERMFRQGSEVKAGDPLYQIDPRPFEVEVQASQAALARAEATSRARGAAGAPHQSSDARARGA